MNLLGQNFRILFGPLFEYSKNIYRINRSLIFYSLYLGAEVYGHTGLREIGTQFFYMEVLTGIRYIRGSTVL